MVSIDIVNSIILIGATLVLLGIASSLVATRFGAPLLLVFLVVGMLAGEDGPGGLYFNDYQTTYLVGSLALSVILFDGGLRTRFATFRGALAPATLLATVGVVITASVTGLAALVLLDLSMLEALLLGAIVASTDAAAVFFLLRTGGMQLRGKVGPVLEIESGTNDPIAVLMTLILTEIILADGGLGAGTALVRLAEQAAFGAVFGLAGGTAIVGLLNRVQMPGGLHPPFVVAAALMIYSGTSLAGGSGLLAVYLAGLMVANRPARAYPSIVGFHDAATWLCQIVMFLVLGLLATPTKVGEYVVPGLAIAVVLTLVARPLAVWICLAPFGFSRREKLFVSWVGLRGAVSIFLAAIPTLAVVPHAPVFFNIAFFVVLASLLVQGWTITGVARRLGLAQRRTAPSVYRVEVDIPGQVEQELVAYPVLPDSLILGLSHLPPWARVILVVREADILTPDEAGAVRSGDYVYLLAPMSRIPRLDRLFGESADVARRMEPLFGELPFNGETTLAEISALYDLELPREELALTIAEYFGRHLRGEPVQGARLPVGGATMTIRRVEGGRVVLAGLQIAELIGAFVATARARQVLADDSVPAAPLQRLGAAIVAAGHRIGRRLRNGSAGD